jgi:hypothetical protein
MSTESTVVHFENAAGRQLTGHLHRRSATPRTFALFAHCLTYSKERPAAARMAKRTGRVESAVVEVLDDEAPSARATRPPSAADPWGPETAPSGTGLVFATWAPSSVVGLPS